MVIIHAMHIFRLAFSCPCFSSRILNHSNNGWWQVYTNAGSDGGFRKGKRMWESQPFTHPATFDTIAMDRSVKRRILQKLDSFAGDAEFYRRTGRPHKFGAFLFGPPG